MERLIRIGQVERKKSIDVRHSRIGLGFEKLDRNVFDPNKAYPYVAESGAKWARLQSGWQRTEREKGVYNFAWLDEIVDNMIAIGVEPWLCLCYGNDLYTEIAKVHFGAVGCPPIYSEEEKQAWINYVHATVEHFKGRIHYYEVWNEPDGAWCWKTGPNAQELADFTEATAKACREADPTCEVIGYVLCRFREPFVDEFTATGVWKHLDGISYHAYVTDEENIVYAFEVYDKIRRENKPSLKIFQGESGTQSRSDGMGALRGMAWTPLKQAKYLLRHLLIDLGCGVEFTSYFSCMDMIEALNGTVGDVNSYLDYGYFGVLGADFDESGRSVGEYSPKLSFKALQTLCSLLCNEYDTAKLPVEAAIEPSRRIDGFDYDFAKARSYGFTKPNGSAALAYWVPKSILTETYEGTTSIVFNKADLPGDITLINMLDGAIYKLPESMIVEEEGRVKLLNLPITDAPMMLCFGEFYL